MSVSAMNVHRNSSQKMVLSKLQKDLIFVSGDQRSYFDKRERVFKQIQTVLNVDFHLYLTVLRKNINISFLVGECAERSSSISSR